MAAPQIQNYQVPGGFDFDEEETKQKCFIETIDDWYFYGNSSTVFMSTTRGKRQMARAMMRKELCDTYFEWLPIEIVDTIFEWERKIEMRIDLLFYTHHYFSSDDSNVKTGRHLRPTRTQRELARSTGDISGLDIIQTPLGDIFGRRIWKNNTAGLVATAFRKMVLSFDDNKAAGIHTMLKLISKYMLWIVHHSYLYEWNSFMRVIYQKQAEFEERLAMYDAFDYKDTIPKEIATPEQRAPVWESLLKIRYFLEQYVPYALLSQSDGFYSVANSHEEARQDHIIRTLFEIYEMTGVHPNNIDLNEAREFEMKLYAPKYYHETYENYMKLRSGRRIIPSGEVPKFYWCAENYIQRFV